MIINLLLLFVLFKFFKYIIIWFRFFFLRQLFKLRILRYIRIIAIIDVLIYWHRHGHCTKLLRFWHCSYCWKLTFLLRFFKLFIELDLLLYIILLHFLRHLHISWLNWLLNRLGLFLRYILSLRLLWWFLLLSKFGFFFWVLFNLSVILYRGGLLIYFLRFRLLGILDFFNFGLLNIILIICYWR